MVQDSAFINTRAIYKAFVNQLYLITVYNYNISYGQELKQVYYYLKNRLKVSFIFKMQIRRQVWAMNGNENNVVYEIISTSEITNVRFCTIDEQGNYVPNHWHRAVEMIYMLEGEQTIIVESKPYVLKAGQCLIIDANVIHSTKATQHDAFILLQLPLEFLEKFVINVSQLTFAFYEVGSKAKKVRLLKQLLRRMKRVDDDKKAGFLLHFNQLLFRLMCLLYDDFAKRVYQRSGVQNKKELVRLNKILAYVM